MRRLLAHRHGEPDHVLAIAELPDDPPPGPGEVSLAVAAVGLNFLDGMLCRGGYPGQPDPPVTPGVELAGRVVAAANTTLVGVSWGSTYPWARPAAVADAYRQLFALHATGAVRPPVSRVVPLAGAAAALADLAARRTTGKLVVQVGG